jgi:hypothetical protein
MLGWRMEEEAKLEFTVTVWRRKTAASRRPNWGRLTAVLAARPKMWVLQLADAEPILGRLHEIVVSEQLQRYCEAARPSSAVIVGAT